MADEISLTEAQFAEAVRALQVQLRAYTAINNGVTAFLQLKEHVATLERKKVELAEQVAAFKATMEKSADLQVEVISRYEKERMKKESEERAKLEAYKKECYEQGKELTDAITELQSRVAQAQARAEKAEHEAEDKIALLDEQVAARQSGVEQQLAEIDEKVALRQAVLDDINARIEELTNRLMGKPAPAEEVLPEQ